MFLFFCVWSSSNLLDLFTEIHYWDRLKYEIPPSVHDIYQRREELRDLREGALLLIRNYNRCEKPSDRKKIMCHIKQTE